MTTSYPFKDQCLTVRQGNCRPTQPRAMLLPLHPLLLPLRSPLIQCFAIFSNPLRTSNNPCSILRLAVQPLRTFSSRPPSIRLSTGKSLCRPEDLYILSQLVLLSGALNFSQPLHLQLEISHLACLKSMPSVVLGRHQSLFSSRSSSRLDLSRLSLLASIHSAKMSDWWPRARLWELRSEAPLSVLQLPKARSSFSNPCQHPPLRHLRRPQPCSVDLSSLLVYYSRHPLPLL